MAKAKVAIVMGSDSDYSTMKAAEVALNDLGVAFETKIISAHRTPKEMGDFGEDAEKSGYRVIIAGAGGAAALPGMLAAHTSLPVIGVPVPYGHLEGQDALLSIVQMPKGVPVATVAIGNAYNAGILAAQIVAFGGHSDDLELVQRIHSYKEKMRAAVNAKVLPKNTGDT